MNTGRKFIDQKKLTCIIKNNQLNPYWLLGFVEAEGTFGIKNLVPYFQISQHKKSQVVLETIKLFLASLPRVSTSILNTSVPSLSANFNKVTNVYSYVITDIDVLFDYILPFFSNLNFYSRKFIDFKL